MRIVKSLVIAVIIALSNMVYGQNHGTITGKVIDFVTKQPLVAANIIVIGTTFGSSTDINGRFTISNLNEDIYKLQVSYVGYSSFIKNDIRVIDNKATDVGEIELSESLIEGETVVVSSGAFYENDEQPVSNYSFSNEELVRAPGAGNDLMRSIATMPGVSISSGGEFSAFSVRGGNPEENIILVDNIPFSKISHLEGGGTEEELGQGGRFSIFSPGLIENVEFQAGGFPVKYGRKNASLVKMDVKTGNQNSPTFSGFADLTGGELVYDGPLFPLQNTSILVSAKHRDFNLLLDLIDAKDQGDPRFSDFIVKTTTDINPDHRISLLGIYSPEYFDITMDHVYESEDLYSTSLVDREEIKSLAGLNWRWLTSNTSYLQNTFYFTKSKLKMVDGRAYTDPINGQIPTKEQAPSRPDIYDQTENETTYGIKSEFTFKPKFDQENATATAGIDLQFVDFDYRFQQNGLDTLYVFDKYDYRANPNQYYVISDPADVNTKYKKQLSSFAGYLQYATKVWDALTVTTGYRLAYNKFNDDVSGETRMSAKYQISERTSINAAGGVFWQTPEYNIIAENANNDNLKSERADHYILGVSHYLSKDLKLNIEAYYKTFRDLIVKPDRTKPLVTNDGKGYAGGLDISLIRRFVDNFYGQISYSYSVSKRDDKNGEGYYNSDFNKPHIFNILAAYEFNKEWQISAGWQYASGYPKDDYIVHSDVFNDPNLLRYSKEVTKNNSKRLKASHTLNLRVDYRKQFGRFGLITFIDILNAYNNLNVTEERFQERDGTIKEMGFEMLPTFGIKFEF